MGIYAITGSATGIGAALRSQLKKQGHEVIGIDIKDADISADLSTPEGRNQALEGVNARAGAGLDGFIPCAGVGPQFEPFSATVSLNFYGSVDLALGLKNLLALKKGAVVMITSNSAPLPGLNPDLVESMLTHDEAKTRELILTLDDGHQAYAGSKLAIARWTRRNAPAWAKDGVRLNAVAPGVTQTPLLQAGLDHPHWGKAIRSFPIPMGDPAQPEQIASVIAFLLSPEAAFCCGSIFFVDGGSDAVIRPDRF